MKADYGKIPDLSKVDFSPRRGFFTWNGTTSGVCVPDGNWIPAKPVRAWPCVMPLPRYLPWKMPWDKLDVRNLFLAEVLGGEAAHGVIILSPAGGGERWKNILPGLAHAENFPHDQKGKLMKHFPKAPPSIPLQWFASKIYIDALEWADNLGGLEAWHPAVAHKNLSNIEEWVQKVGWIQILADRQIHPLQIHQCALNNRRLVCKTFSPKIQAKAQKKLYHCLKPKKAAMIGSLHAMLLPVCVSGRVRPLKKKICAYCSPG